MTQTATQVQITKDRDFTAELSSEVDYRLARLILMNAEKAGVIDEKTQNAILAKIADDTSPRFIGLEESGNKIGDVVKVRERGKSK